MSGFTNIFTVVIQMIQAQFEYNQMTLKSTGMTEELRYEF